jgi:hypothetical protein
MIGIGRSIANIQQRIDYVISKKDAYEVDRNKLTSESSAELASEMRRFHKLNARCKNSTFSFILSPVPEDGEKLTSIDFLNITHDFLVNMGLENTQYLSVAHLHQSTPHLHILVNRINEKGKAVKDHFIGLKAQRAAEKTAIKNKLTTVKEVRNKKLNEQRKIIEPAHKAVLKMNPKSVDEYFLLMKEKGINSKQKYSNSGKLVGISFLVQGEQVKASAINRKLSASQLSKQLDQLQKPKKKFFKKIKRKL